MDSDCPDVLNILTVLTQKTFDCKEAFNSVCIGNCLNGLQGMSSDNAVVIEMLRALVIKVAKSPDAITSQCIGSALMGVRRMDTSTTVVKTLLAILALKINESQLVLDPISFSMALNGLRSMDESSVEIRALLSTLNEKINNMDEKVLSPNVISNAMSGLRKMSGEHPESRQVLTAILSKMGTPIVPVKANGPAPESINTRQQSSIGQFTSLDIGRALYGLQSMSAESNPNVLPALSRMALAVRTSRGPLYARDAGLALFGLKSHIEEGVEVKEILSAITSRLSLSEDTLNAKSASMAMMGLQGLTSESKEICDLLVLLSSRIGNLDSQACGNILYSMKKMTSSKSEVRAFLAAIAPKIEACDETMSSQELANAFYGETNLVNMPTLLYINFIDYFCASSIFCFALFQNPNG